MKLIDKGALIAEIKKLINKCNDKKRSCPVNTQIEAICVNKIYSFKEVISLINTFEVKEVDSEKVFLDEYSKFSNDTDAMFYTFPIDLADYKDFAKHFFALGMTVSNKAQNIWHDANEKLPAGVIVVSNCGSLKIGWSTDEGDGIEDEHGRLITKTYQKWAREEDLA